MSKKIFLFSDSQADFEFTQAAARASGFEVVKAHLHDSIEKLLTGQPESVVFLSKAIKTPPQFINQIHLFCDNAEEIAQLQNQASSQGIGSFISRKWSQPATAGETYAFALKVFLGGAAAIKPDADNKTYSSLRLNNSLQKNWAASAVQFHLAGLSFRKQVASGIVGATDELIMNAIFDAPQDSAGRPRYKAPSDAEFELAGRDAVELEFFQPTPDSFCMTVIDLHGSLKRADIRKHLAQAFSPAQVDRSQAQSDGRAGLGLATVFRSHASLIFRSVSGERTEAVAWFHISRKGSASDETFQFLATFI